MKYFFILPLISCLLYASPTLSQSFLYDIPRSQAAPIIDGVIEENEWQHATQVSLDYEISPGLNLPASAKTTVYITEDGESIFFAFIASDSHPENILAFLRDRDDLFQDDYIEIIIDTFNDERRGFEFFVNPLGSQADGIIDDTQKTENYQWDTVWESRGNITESGYVVELSIPYKALRYTPNLDKQVWGITLVRSHPRDSRKIYSDHPIDRNLDCTLCQAAKMTGMPSLKSNINIEVAPTLTHKVKRDRDPEQNTNWNQNSDTELGADLRWAVTENWIMNATINPDFSQIEADVDQLDVNTTFSLFYPESRPFFLDGSEYFSSLNRLVHTRNIADPDFGVKLTGKSTGHSFGLITARDAQTSFILPGKLSSDIAVFDATESDILIARYQKDFNKKDNIGGLVTHRSTSDYSNTVTSIDGKYFIGDFDSFDIQLVHSSTTNSEESLNDFGLPRAQSDIGYTAIFKRTKENYSLFTEYKAFGENFRADLGFINKVGYKLARVGGSYTWYGDKENTLTRWGLYSDWDRTEDFDGKLLEEEFEARFNLTGRKQVNAAFGFSSRKRLFNEQYFNEDSLFGIVEFKPFTNLTYFTYVVYGDQIDFDNTRLGKQLLIEPSIRLQLNKHFEFKLSATYQKLTVSEGTLFTAQLYDARFNYQFDSRNRLSLTFQSSKLDKDPSLYLNAQQELDKSFGTKLIYSYQISPISLLYLGYSDNAIANDQLDSLEHSNKTAFLKVSYSW